MQQAVKQGYGRNPGILAMFILKQWGHEFNTQFFQVFCLALVSTLDVVMNE